MKSVVFSFFFLLSGVSLTLLVQNYFETKNQPAGEQLIDDMKFYLKQLMVAEAMKVAAANGIRWSEEEFPVMAAYCEAHDLPPAVGIAIRKMENGGFVYKMGVHKVHRGIRSKTWPDHQQYEAAARLGRRGVWFLMLQRDDIRREVLKKRGPWAEPEDVVRMYPTAYWNFMADKIYKPQHRRKEWKDFTLAEFKRLEGSKK